MDFLKTMSVGVCYYPEHWDESLWESDLKRMLDNGIHTVRIGEFAWSIMEREEGSFDFSFFDRFLDLCASTGMQVIFGTPTATPPAWLTCRYPETLNATAAGGIIITTVRSTVRRWPSWSEKWPNTGAGIRRLSAGRSTMN